MYHLIIEHLGVKRCIAKRETDDFSEGMSVDCSLDHACFAKKHIRNISIVCTGDKKAEKKAGIYSD